MPELFTWAGRSTFSYTGSVATGTRIAYGANHSATVSAEQYRAMLAHFRGRTAPIGTSRTNPPKGSLGEWLRENVTPRALASYVGAILVAERYAHKGETAEIRFL